MSWRVRLLALPVRIDAPTWVAGARARRLASEVSAYDEEVRHTRLDSLLLAGVGTLAVHEVAYTAGSLTSSVAGNGVSHGHIPLLWGVGGAVAVAGLAYYIVSSLRSRSGDRFVDPKWLGGAVAAFYVSQEAAERALAGGPALSLLTEPVLWLGLLAVPFVAIVLARLARCIVTLVASEPVPRTPAAVAPTLVWPSWLPPVATGGDLEYSLVRRGPPLHIAF